MTEREEKDLREYCAFMLKEYGFDFAPTDPVIPALYVMHKEMQTNKKSNDIVLTAIKEAAKNINPTVYNFNQAGEAWKYQMAIGLKWFLILGAFILGGWGWYMVILANGKLFAAEDLVNAAPRIEKELLPLVKKDKEGFYFLEFEKSKDDQISNFFEYHELSNGKARVYLGSE